MATALHKVACFVLRPPVTRWPSPRGPWWARARRWCLHVLLREPSETCDACGGRVPFAWWCEDDALWEHVYWCATGRVSVRRGGCCSGLLCLACFDRCAPPVMFVARRLLTEGSAQ